MKLRAYTLPWLVVILLLAAACGGEPSASSEEGDISTLPAGVAVDLAAEAIPGKVTIFDFYADWCAPCAILGPALEDLARRRPTEIALRKVDVIGWGSDTAMHQGIEYLPYLAVVDDEGNMLADGDDSFAYLKENYDLDLLEVLRGF
jgi:thiol-disulfide isomerase/thioredoxin